MVENIYRKARSLHEIRLQFIDDTNYCIQDSKGNRRDNPYLDLKRSQMEKEGPHPDFDLLCYQYELALHVLDRAEVRVLNSGNQEKCNLQSQTSDHYSCSLTAEYVTPELFQLLTISLQATYQNCSLKILMRKM